MKAKDIMTTQIVSVNRNDSIKMAAQKMTEADVGTVIVNDNDELIGIITDRDITIRAVSEYDDLDSVTCGDIMSSHVITAEKDTDLEDVISLMKDHQIKRIPIVENDSVVGMISLRDISQTIEWEDKAGEVLNCITD